MTIHTCGHVVIKSTSANPIRCPFDGRLMRSSTPVQITSGRPRIRRVP